ncbi:NERD domain-containing protein [Myroides sp. NP-2]|uniref:nuclease-related domain-containing DEAD/DEAH box helicase n=1 Tax=Myroides sp. NP-2 TaxID=2759945 RepID=UPI0015FDB4E6|nr:NERD domain-containing protein/DEAD/DEAH box helicase [Myroides sp. NP-2]MBB1149896.1 NERD domain-containing protein [Myroides sp. NP-2]
MALKIYPEYPLDELEQLIINGNKVPYGEFLIYGDLVQSLSESEHDWYVWYSLRLPFHDNTRIQRAKADAELDFIIVSRFGIIVLEVKGGNVVVDQGRFCFKDGDHMKWLPQNPFEQVKGYKYTLMNKVFPNFKHVQFCEAVAFPTTKIAIENTIYDKNLIYSDYTRKNEYHNIERFLLHIYDYTREKLQSVHPIAFKKLKANDLSYIVNTFSPKVQDTNVFASRNSYLWLKERNLDYLYSLAENPRLMIEGSPGTGKTTMAMAYAEMQVEREGIYLCWNALLCAYNQQRFKERNVRIECMTFKQLIANYHPHVSEKEIYYLKPLSCAKLVKETLEHLEEQNQLPDYDYMIIDEAQDLLDRNLALLIDKLCGDGQGLTQGNVMLLYDLDQSFSLFGRDVTEYAYFLKDYFTHFKLHKIRRSAQKSQIRQIAEHIQESPEEWEEITIHQQEYDEIELRSFEEVEELKNAMVTIIDNITDPSSSLTAEDVIVLVQSKVWQRRNNVADLIVDLQMEELTPDKLTLTPSVLQYTTALKYKGLERKNVILIVDKPDQFTPFEWYVGCTRAIDNLSIWQLHTYQEHEEE